MDIAPLYFNYESPDVSKGKMYVHPFEDIKQSQIWKMESENMMNSLPSMMREYLTFDKFDEDTDRYNTIINNFTTEIDRITDDIQANGVTRDNQRAINDLATNINQQMATGDLSLMRDNLASFRAWEAKEMEAGKEDPVLYQRMRDAKKNEFLNNTSRDNLISIGTEQIVSRPDFNDYNIKRSAMFELAKRITQKSAESPIETSWGTEDDLADIINGVFKTEDRGYVQQQAKYLHGIPNPVYEDPIIVVEDEKGNRTAIVNPYHPYAKEASEYLAQMRATQKQYEHTVSVKGKGRGGNGSSSSDGSQFNEYLSPSLGEANVDINTAYAFTPIYTLTAPEQSQALDGVKIAQTRRAMIDAGTFNGLKSAVDYWKGIPEAEDIMDILGKIRNSDYIVKNGKQTGFDKAVNNYFYGAKNIETDGDDWLIDYLYDTRRRILIAESKYHYYKYKDGDDVNGLKNGVILHKEGNDLTAITDRETGLKYEVSYVESPSSGSDYVGNTTGFVCTGVYFGDTLYRFDELEKIYTEKLKPLQQAYTDYNTRGKRSYKAITLDVAEDSDVNMAIVKNMNNNKKHLVIVDKRDFDQKGIDAIEEKIKNTKDKKKKEELQKERDEMKRPSSKQQDWYYGNENGFDDDYEVVKVKKYVGTVDGIKSVFECEVDTGGDKTETKLIGVTNKGNGGLLQYAIQDDLIHAYIDNGEHTIPENLFYALTDQNRQDFMDYLTTYTVYDNSDKTQKVRLQNGSYKWEYGADYFDVPLDGELERYMRLNFENDAFKIRIFNPTEGNREYMLYWKNSETGNWEPIENNTGDDRITLEKLYDYVMTYGLDKTFRDKKDLTYDGTMNSSLYKFFDNYFPKTRIGSYNYTFGYLMKGKSRSGKTYKDYPTYNTEIFDHVVLNALAKTCFNNSNKDDISFKSGCSFLLAGLFTSLANDPKKSTTRPLYELINDPAYDDISPYISFGKEHNTDTLKDGGQNANLITTGTLLYLPQTKREGIVYAQYDGSKYIKYVLSAYNGKLEMIPLEKFLDSESTKTANGKTKYCHVGRIKDKYYSKYMGINKEEEE